MKQKIAIEPNLTPIKDFLSNKGYSVDSINFGEQIIKSDKNYDAFIVTGIDTNFMGISDTNSKAVVINAKGLTAEQVYHELQKKFE
ncbi:MAG: YkuS family protein [Clostridia bacterium]|nr:YkuS family protein [Clostridia bacterium]